MYFLITMVFLMAILIVIYNELVRKSNHVKEAFSLIDVYLKQRFDLINRVHNSRMMFAAELAADLGKTVPGQFFTDIHCDLTGDGDAARIIF